MNPIDNILNTALLGTATKEPALTDFPEELHETIRLITEQATETEDAFYKSCALLFAYCRAGVEAPPRTPTDFPEAPPEDRPYLSRESASFLHRLMLEKNYVLLQYGYALAAQTGKLLPPEYLPGLLQHAFETNTAKAYQEKESLLALAGNRGKWLLPQLGQAVQGDETDDDWETAPHVARRAILTRMRKENPAKGIELLQSTLKGESAQHRMELVVCLRTGLSAADEPFLATLYETDRSAGVKEVARSLLESIPGSAVCRFYCEALRGKLKYNRLLGWSYEKITYTPELKQAGIEEVSPNKKENDNEFILRQLAERVPLSFWCELFDADEEKAARKLAQRPPFPKFFFPAVPILKFNDELWAYYTLMEASPTPVELLGLLPAARREEIKLTLPANDNPVREEWFGNITDTWGERFSRSIADMRTAGRQYMYYTKEEAEKLAVYMPLTLKEEIRAKGSNRPEHSHQRAFLFKIVEHMNTKEELIRLFEQEATSGTQR